MELDGILKAWMKKLLTKNAISAAISSDSTYSLVLLFCAILNSSKDRYSFTCPQGFMVMNVTLKIKK
jgi:hypothetical protein